VVNVGGEQNMEEIFIYSSNEDNPIIVLASEAVKYTDSINKSIYLRLKDGIRYEGLPGDENINILGFEKYDLEIVSGEIQKSISNSSEIEEKSSVDLILLGGPIANAEFQWRLSQPISILILSIIGVILGKTSPRTGKGLNVLLGVIIFMLYNNVLLVAKNSIGSGQLNPFIGLWSIHILLIILIIIFYQFRQGKFSSFVDKISPL
jgi:lipopolysaccharide export system permease protein